MFLLYTFSNLLLKVQKFQVSGSKVSGFRFKSLRFQVQKFQVSGSRVSGSRV